MKRWNPHFFLQICITVITKIVHLLTFFTRDQPQHNLYNTSYQHSKEKNAKKKAKGSLDEIKIWREYYHDNQKKTKGLDIDIGDEVIF